MMLIFGLAGAGHAATYTVCALGCDADTLEGGILAAKAPGDVVEVGEPGTWNLPTTMSLAFDLTIRATTPRGVAPTILTGDADLFQVQAGATVSFEGFDLGGAFRLAIVFGELELVDFVAEDLVRADTGLVAYVLPSGILSITDSTFRNLTGSSGTIASLSISSQLLLTGVTVDNVDATGPGGAFHSQGSVDISTSTFTNCDTGSDGGALWVAGDLVLTDSTFQTGDAGNRGGFIFNAATVLATATITNTVFDGGVAGSFGGAAWLENVVSVSFDDVDVTNCEATGGGGVALLNSSARVTGGAWSDNNATGILKGINGHGGAIYADENLVVDGTRFERNDASLSGGAIGLYGFNPSNNWDISGATFLQNTAFDSGGAILADGDTPMSVSGSVFTSNTAAYGGGLKAEYSGVLAVSDSVFVGNTATDSGGAVWTYSSNDVTLARNLFAYNVSLDPTGWGGAVGTYATTDTTVTHCAFVENEGFDGGAVWTDGSLEVYHSDFLGNSASAGAAITMDVVGNGALVNNLFSSNLAPAGGFVVQRVNPGALVPMVVEYNAWYANTGGGELDGTLGVTLGVTDLVGLDPMLTALSLGDDDPFNDDYHPLMGSPLFGAGTQLFGGPSSPDIGIYGGLDPVVDDDSDGWWSGVDCDDAISSTNPGETEVCDGFDNNCDGVVDEGFSSVQSYVDADGDGYGAPGSVSECLPDGTLPGGATVDGDCDDGDAAVRPGAEELCDGVDNDCDGLDDDGVELVERFVDADGDGYGPSDSRFDTCDASAGVEIGGDCDDTTARIHPDASEIPMDGIDQDCDDSDAVQRLAGRSCSCDAAPVSPGLAALLGLVIVARRRIRPSLGARTPGRG